MAAHRNIKVMRRCLVLLKYISLILFLFLCFFIKIPGVIPNQLSSIVEKDKIEIIDLVKKSVEDTRWMRASTPEELDVILSCYYTTPLVSRLNNSVWEFINKPTDWDYIIKAENIEIISISQNKASVYFDIAELDTLTRNKFSNKAECHLVKTENGWRINHLLINDT